VTWFATLRHDLVKRLLWPARDRRDMGGAPGPGELLPSLIDGDGRPTTAAALWRTFRAGAPAELARASAALDDFEAALARALAAAEAGDVAGVLAFEADVEALARLARSLDGSS
jgi:hypothetical protein